MRIRITSVPVDNQEKTLQFYMRKLGLVAKSDIPLGEFRWLTVVSPDEENDVELLLEPLGFAPANTYQQELFKAAIPYTSFAVENIETEAKRLEKAGVVFRSKPAQHVPVMIAVIEDTCGDLIQLMRHGLFLA